MVFQEFSNEERCRAAKSTLEGSLKEAGAKLKSGLEDLKSLALQLHFLSEVSAASVGLVSTPPERPCENTVDRDAPLSELDGDATDFLD